MLIHSYPFGVLNRVRKLSPYAYGLRKPKIDEPWHYQRWWWENPWWICKRLNQWNNKTFTDTRRAVWIGVSSILGHFTMKYKDPPKVSISIVLCLDQPYYPLRNWLSYAENFTQNGEHFDVRQLIPKWIRNWSFSKPIRELGFIVPNATQNR